MSKQKKAVYTYDGNANETYYIFKNGKIILEAFMGEDDVLFLTNVLNDFPIKLDTEGVDLSSREDNAQNQIYSELRHYLSNDESEYDDLIKKLQHELRTMPNYPLDFVDGVEVWEKVAMRFTVREFCDLVGIRY